MSLFPLGLISQGGSGGGANFELISTTIISGTSTSTVTFDVSTLASTYKHLQVRITARSNSSANWLDMILCRFNSDTASNYSQHELYAYHSGASGIASGANLTTSIPIAQSSMTLGVSDTFSANIIDVLEPFSTSKYKTTRSLSGVLNYASPSSGDRITLISGNWRNTAAITSMSFIEERGVNFVAGSRFSLYGVRG